MYKLKIRSEETSAILLEMITPDVVEYTLLVEMALKYYSSRPIIRIKRGKSLTLTVREPN